jgi:hypothetical protein
VCRCDPGCCILGRVALPGLVDVNLQQWLNARFTFAYENICDARGPLPAIHRKLEMPMKNWRFDH